MKKFFLNLKAFLKRNNSNTQEKIAKILLRNAIKIASAESCTGGLISSRLTDVAGSSAYVHANFVTYSNKAKQKILNVSAETLSKYGAVSAQCAAEMAQGLFKLTNADIVICTTGVAGPSESEEKSAGLMFAACGYNNNITVKEYKLDRHYNRKNMKFMFSEKALELVLAILGE